MRPRRGHWAAAGCVVAVLVAIAGLVMLAYAVIVVVGVNSFGSNK